VVCEGLILGVVVISLFTLLPLLRLKEVRPHAIFGKEEPQGRTRLNWTVSAVVILVFLILVLLRIQEVRAGILFVLGVGLLILVSWITAAAVLRGMRTAVVKNLVVRQALKGLFRPRNATLPVMVTLTASLAVIFSITLVEKNLDASFVRSYPGDAPNLFFLDIQSGQKEAFASALGVDTVFYPVVRGSVIAVNDEPVDREQERKKRGDNLAREFNLTYRETLLDDERIIGGNGLFRNDWTGPQVSVLDTVLEMRDFKIGDRITFRIQGIPLEARISSIRTRTRTGVQPFFYFVFQEQVLKDAPQTLFTALRLEKKAITPLQNRIVARFPNVSVIDVTETVAVFAKIMSRLSAIVRFFMLFSVAAGILIIISSVFATRYTRVREAVFFTILGARRRFSRAVFAVENLFMGTTSSFIALGLAQSASWIISRHVLDITYRPFAGLSLLLALAAILVVVAVGLGASVPVLSKKPALFLREHAEE
jgi:putative ABC transport system permease protein